MLATGDSRPIMTEQEKIRRDIADLRENLKLCWRELFQNRLSPPTRQAIRDEIKLVMDQIQLLLARLEP